MNTYEKDMSFHEFALVLEGKQTCFFKENSFRCPPVIIFDDSKSIAMFDWRTVTSSEPGNWKIFLSEKFDINWFYVRSWDVHLANLFHPMAIWEVTTPKLVKKQVNLELHGLISLIALHWFFLVEELSLLGLRKKCDTQQYSKQSWKLIATEKYDANKTAQCGRHQNLFKLSGSVQSMPIIIQVMDDQTLVLKQPWWLRGFSHGKRTPHFTFQLSN